MVTKPGAWGYAMLVSSQNSRGLFIQPLTNKTVGTGNEMMSAPWPQVMVLTVELQLLLIIRNVFFVVVVAVVVPLT